MFIGDKLGDKSCWFSFLNVVEVSYDHSALFVLHTGRVSMHRSKESNINEEEVENMFFLSPLWNHFLCCLTSFLFASFKFFILMTLLLFLWLKLACFAFRASKPVYATSSSAAVREQRWTASFDWRKKMETKMETTMETKMAPKIDTKMKVLAINCWRWGEGQRPHTSDTVSSL